MAIALGPAHAAVIDYADGSTDGNPYVLTDNSTQLRILTGSATQAGDISDGGNGYSLEKIGAGTLTLAAANTYGGGTFISGGTLLAANNDALGTGAVTISNGASLGIGNGVSLLFNDITIDAAARLFVDNGVPAEFGGAIFDGVGANGFTKTGGGNLIFSGFGSYTGTTTVADGTLTLAWAGALGVDAAYAVDSGATLLLDSDFFELRSLSGEGTVQFSNFATLIFGRGGSSTFSGILTGDGYLDLEGSGTLTLDGSVIHALEGLTLCSCSTGGLTLRNGTLNLLDTAYIDRGTVTVEQGAQFNAADLYVAGAMVVDDAQATVTGFTGIGDPFTYNSFLTIRNGAVMESQSGAGVDGDGSFVTTAAVSVAGSGSQWNVSGGELEIGLNALGVVTVADGGALTALDGLYIYSNGVLNIGNSGAGGTISAPSYFTNDGQIVADFTDTVTLSDAIDGSGTLTKRGAGTLILSGSNSYTGDTNFLGGTIQVTDDFNLGDGGALVFDGGALKVVTPDVYTFFLLNDLRTVTLDSGGGTLDVEGGTAVFLNDISGAGGLTVTGSGGYAVLGGNNSFDGGVTVNGGATLIAIEDGNFGAAGGSVTLNNGTLLFLDDVTLSSGRALNLAGDGSIAVSAFASEIAGSITGSGALNIMADANFGGGGVLYLTGNNTYNGGTFLQGDPNLFGPVFLAITSDSNLGAAAGGLTIDMGGIYFDDDLTLNAGRTVTINGEGALFDTDDHTVEIAGQLAGAGPMGKDGSGTLILTGNNSFTGDVDIVDGTLQIGNGGASGSLAAASVTSSGTLAFNLSGNLTFSADISDSCSCFGGAVAQLGSGILTLTGDSSYTGATTVSAGTLAVNGSIDASSGVLVENGGTLGGTGTVSTVVVNAGGALAPGNSIGTLTVNGDLTLQAGSIFGVEVSPTAADKLVVTGDADLNGGLVASFATGGGYSPGSYTLMTVAGTLNGSFSSFNTLGFPAGYVADVVYGAHEVTLNLAYNDFIWGAGAGSGDWNDAASWTHGLVPVSTSTAEFGTSSRTAVTITASTSVSAIRLDSDAPAYSFTVTGSTFTLANGITQVTGNAASFTAQSGALVFNGGNAAASLLTAGNGGTIRFAGAANAGSDAQLTAQAGGTVDFTATAGPNADNRISAGSIAGAGNFLLGANTLTVGALNSSTEVSGVISGTGGLVKTGSGTLTLSGANTYSGATTITAGVLAVNGSIANSAVTVSGGALKGNGTVGSLALGGGTLAPGNSIGTLNVAGGLTLAPGSVYEVEVNAAGQSDLINVGGTATLAGSVLVQPASGSYAGVTTYRVINAGSIAGSFAGGVSSSAANLTPTLIYSATTVDLRLVRNDLDFAAITGGTANQIASGGAVTAGGVSSGLYLGLAATGTASMPAALDALSGEVHASLRTALIADGALIRDALMGRLAAASGGGVAAWGSVFALSGALEGDGNAAAMGRHAHGMVFGLDMPLTDNLRAGVAGAYAGHTLSVAGRASRASGDSGHLAFYAGWSDAALRLRAGADFGWGSSDIGRGAAFLGESNSASQSHDTVQLFAEAGYVLPFTGFSLEPYAGLAWSQAQTGAFRESGGALSALSGSGGSDNLMLLDFGARLAADPILLADVTLVPRAAIGYRHALSVLRPGETVQFLSTGRAFAVLGDAFDRDAAVAQFGLDMNLAGGARLGLGYEGLYGGRGTDHALRARLGWDF